MRATIAPSSPLICLLVLFGIIKATEGDSDVQSYPSTITSQYCIIGGGSSGTYAAVRLQQLGRTVTLIEKESRLGGHVNTYSDPVTGDSFDYGVITFDNMSVVTDYFDYLDVPLAPLTYSSATIFIDFANGSIVPDASLPQGNSTAAFIKYIDLVDDEYSYLSNGFNLPSPVPEDLLMTWGDFLEKYDLGDLAFTAFTFLEGVGNILAQPTLYILKYLAKVTVENILGENMSDGIDFDCRFKERGKLKLYTHKTKTHLVFHVTTN